MDWGVLYIIENLLECKCLKWVHMTHLDTSNTSYGQKKGWESNWQFDYWPLKVKNRPNFLACRWCATYPWKAFNNKYNFALDLISIKSLHAKLWTPKVARVPIVGISRLPLGSFRTKWHLGAGIKYTIMGKVVASPKSRPWWILWVRDCPWFILAPKMFLPNTNQLVVWFCANPCEWLIACHSS
jgi:hypothetical protein